MIGVWYFSNAGEEEYYFGSADWMPRNFDRRVEAVAPVEDASLHPRLWSLLETCLNDNLQAWDLQPDGSYVQRSPNGSADFSAHQVFLQHSWGLGAAEGAKPKEPSLSRTKVR
jgi:polyphosphate kinase